MLLRIAIINMSVEIPTNERKIGAEYSGIPIANFSFSTTISISLPNIMERIDWQNAIADNSHNHDILSIIIEKIILKTIVMKQKISNTIPNI